MRRPVGAPQQRQFHQLVFFCGDRANGSAGVVAKEFSLCQLGCFPLFNWGILGLAFATAKS